MSQPEQFAEIPYSDVWEAILLQTAETNVLLKSLLSTMSELYHLDSTAMEMASNPVPIKNSEKLLSEIYRLSYDNGARITAAITFIAAQYENTLGLSQSDFLKIFTDKCTALATNITLGKILRRV